MKQKKIIILAISGILIFAATIAGAQNLEWTMQTHPKEIYKLAPDIEQYTNQGYVPFGLGEINSNLVTFFMRGEGVYSELWQLKW